MSSYGKFIVVEGTEGSGKTTQLSKVQDRLIELGYDVIITREPGGTPMAEEIRELTLRTRDETVSPITEMLLMFASREQHLLHTIRPALEAGKVVLCSRFVEASYAYQVVGRGASEDLFYNLVVNTVGNTIPDLTVFMDVGSETSKSRQATRGEDYDRIEKSPDDYFTRVDDIMRQLATLPKHHTIDAEQPVSEVTEQIVKAVLMTIKETPKTKPETA